MTAQTRDTLLVFVVRDPCYCKLRDPGMTHSGSTGQDPNLGSRWHHWLFTSGCSSLLFSLQFCLSLLYPHPSVSLFLPFLHYLLAPHCGTQGSPSIWAHLRSGLRNVMPCLGIVAPGRIISAPRLAWSSQASSLSQPWYQSGCHLGLAPCLTHSTGPF